MGSSRAIEASSMGSSRAIESHRGVKGGAVEASANGSRDRSVTVTEPPRVTPRGRDGDGAHSSPPPHNKTLHATPPLQQAAPLQPTMPPAAQAAHDSHVDGADETGQTACRAHDVVAVGSSVSRSRGSCSHFRPSQHEPSRLSLPERLRKQAQARHGVRMSATTALSAAHVEHASKDRAGRGTS